MPYVPYIALGVVSLLLQITVLRELLTVYSGNELDIGITLSLWLVFVGAGSFAGSKLRAKNAFGLSFLLVSALAIPTLASTGLIRPALALAHGETVPLGATFLSTALVLFPLCFALGLQFPLAVAHRDLTEKGAAAEVYGLEAAGAFLGGVLFTFALSGTLGPGQLGLSIGVLCVILAAYLLKRTWLVVLALLPITLFLAAGHVSGVIKDREPAQTVMEVRSKYGEIKVTRLGGQRNLYQAGRLLFSYPDPQAEEMEAHLPMLAHPSPARVLVVGGSPGAIREFLKHPVERLDYVEMDPLIIEASMVMLEGEDIAALEDARVRVVPMDGRRYIKSIPAPGAGAGDGYDMVLVNISEPSTASANRFFTEGFFKEAKGVLRKDGLIVVRLQPSSGYVGRRLMVANGSVLNALKAVFPYVEATTEEYALLFGSESPLDLSSPLLIMRLRDRKVVTRHFGRYLVEDALEPARRELFMERLSQTHATNTDIRPSAYLYNLMLWAEMHGAWLLALVLRLKGYSALIFCAAYLAGAAFVLKRKRRTLYYSMLGTGFSGMAFVVALMLAFQAEFGYVYEMFGLLSAIFMVGMAIGTYAVRSGGLRGPKAVLVLELCTATIALLSVLFFRSEALFYIFSLLAGQVTGGGFAAVSACPCMKGEHAGGSAGRLYAVDLAGSFLGASLTSLVFVPVIGIKETIYMVAALKLCSAVLVGAVLKEEQ